MMASVSHPMDMIPVCPTCLEAHKTDQDYTQQLRSNGCLEPQVHSDREDWPLSVINEMSSRHKCVLFIRTYVGMGSNDFLGYDCCRRSFIMITMIIVCILIRYVAPQNNSE